MTREEELMDEANKIIGEILHRDATSGDKLYLLIALKATIDTFLEGFNDYLRRK